MGVKSTITLTRAEAERRYLELRNLLLKSMDGMTNAHLEQELEYLNDAVNGGEGFENYVIRESRYEKVSS